MLTADRFLRSGKVRDLYGLPDGRLLLVASDRLSAFDVVLPTEIPDKGRVLTGLSRFWFAETAGIVPNHLLDTDLAIVRDAYDIAIGDRPADGPAGPVAVGSFDEWRGRVMICQRAEVVPVEAVVRGYLAGSGWKEYRERGTVCGIPLPPGLRESDRLPEPIFTPATKAERGEHDENIDFDEMVEHIGQHWITPPEFAGPVAEVIRDHAIALYRYAAAVAGRAGILLADTKFEFGRDPATGELVLGDEVLTPDSSRFWPVDDWQPGRAQPSFDKQYVRDWLLSTASGWDRAGAAAPPALPADVVAATRSRYVEAYERLTGLQFGDWPTAPAEATDIVNTAR
jgi:phosphoribosylaminoimidazole-succinocarboxamide synthase